MGTDTTFFGLLPIETSRFSLSEPVESNRLASGEVLTASLGAALWQGEVTLSRRRSDAVQEIEARIDRLLRPGEYFEAYDVRRNGPKSDEGGVILGASTPTIDTLGGDNKSLSLTGLPAGYVLSAGDYIGWNYGSSPVRTALHRLVTGATADGLGVTPSFEVAPYIRSGVSAGAGVTLVRPVIKAKLTSADYGGGAKVFTAGARFSFIQTLR